MQLRHALIGTAALGAAAAAVSAVLLLHPFSLRHGSKVTSGQAQLHVYGGRSASSAAATCSAKLDGALADLSRHAGKVRPDHAIEDLHSLSPAARFPECGGHEPPLRARGCDHARRPAAIEIRAGRAWGSEAAVYRIRRRLAACRSARGRGRRAEVLSVRAAMPRTRAGAVTSQGDFAQRSSVRAHQFSDP